jgi:predicted MFS family arabinose efflux permease
MILGLSWNIYLVILSRIPPALFKHSLDIIKVAATDALDPAARSAAIGRLNAASNAGFIIGPIVGGYVSAIPNGFNYTTMLTVAVLGVNYALVFFFYEDHAPVLSTAATKRVDYKRLLVDAKNKLFEFKNVMNESGPAQTLLIARLLLAMAAILYRTHFSTLLEDKFGTDPKTRGFVLSYMGLLGAFGSVSVGWAARLIRSERLLLQVSSVVYVATFVALSRVQTIHGVFAWLAPQVVAISMIRASSIGLQTSLVAPERVGAFMGISASFTVRSVSLHCDLQGS